MQGEPPGGAFSLTDHFGRPATDKSFHGRHVMMFFGFTHCHLVCPRALARLSDALGQLGPLADRVQALYVTVDPERDNPEVMRGFLQDAYPRFLGLTGTAEQIDAVRRAYRVFTRRAADHDDPGGYAMPHTALTYIMDPQGRYITHLTDTVTAEEAAACLGAVLEDPMRC